MKKILQAMVGVALSVLATQSASAAEPTWKYTVQVSATVQESPARITLSWPQDTLGTPSSYTVYRKSLNGTDWGGGTTLSGSTTSYIDNNVTVGSAYEYQIVKAASGYTGYGYIYAGIKAPLVDNRGKVVLVVDNTHAAGLATELNRLQQDLVGDGWTVVRHDVSRNDTPPNIKNLIRSTYNADPGNVKAVFLFGHVPVPYSGNIVPDGHFPDHQGAWPADAYYGDMDGSWTDNSVSSTSASDARNRNVPGDGKFDQSEMPSAIELQVGRVDLANMPGRKVWGGPATFPSETELLRQYLNKDNNFRNKRMNAPVRAVVHDSFGERGGEAFAASAYRSFAPLVGANQIATIDPKGQWIPHLSGNNYLWAYGCGAGSYSTIGGLGNTGQYQDGTTVEVVENDIKAAFTILFGSWLGDWDSEDNIMRAVLATRTMGLASAWSGRPHWFYHHVGLGEPIGYAARIAQNNTGLYRTQINSSSRNIHIALMGDPTLRIHPVAPPSGVVSSGSTLTWSASSDANAGYHVYRAASANGPFTRLTSSPITGTSYTDNNGAGTFTYMVRAIKLENTPSGTYYNASQGAFVGGTGGGGGGDTTPPSVSVTTPSGGGTVSGSSVAVSANASDNIGVVGVQFKVDGSNIGGEDTSSPYSASWNTTSAANGSHTITAVARDAAGNQTTSSPITVNVSNGGGTASNPPPTSAWVDDAVPTGAQANGEGGDTWNWISSNPTPFSGSLAHQSAIAQGMHQHFFDWATSTLTVNAGDSLYAYVYLDPANPPSELMLQWKTDTSWDHRAYWGANSLTFGTDGTAGRRYMGPLPPVGQWYRLTVPASQVELEGSQLRGMAFTVFNGRVTWDAAGAGTLTPTVDTTPPTVALTSPATGSVAVGTVLSVAANATDNVGVAGVQFRLDSAPLNAEDTQPPYAVTWNTVGALGGHQLTAVSRDLAGNRATSAIVSVMVTNVSVPPGPTNPAPTSVVADVTLELPKVGDHRLRILSPSVLELELVTRKEPDPAQPNPWNFVNSSFQLQAPAPSEFTVTANGQNVAVQSVAFKRRPLYVPLDTRDLRLGNYLYLQLGSAIAEGQNVVVQNPSGTVIAPGMVFTNAASPLRFSPAIHVNQEGYVPSFPKKAMVGYYLGSAGEMTIPTAGGFKIVDAQSGAQVYQGTLTLRADVGYEISPMPYQKVYQADFSNFRTPGEYRLVVPGLGASLPFMIDDGIAMGMTRAYALGLYHQRCGCSTEMPFTRHHHDECHMAAADVPMPASSFQFTWNKVAEKSGENNNNPRHTAPQLRDPASQRYPFVKTGKIDVSKGHHDAGDYSKYTINSAGLVHYLVFAVDSFPGVAALDNLGLPDSGDGISDILQEAKWEADYLAKIQDTDGGFYFLVYPRDREYENNVTPDNGDPQVVWPKTTSATAAAVAALAQIASSPTFKRTYPAEAAMYLQKAQLGWQFLINAINQFGKDGAYQKITHYGDEFMHDDELAWAAAELFAATGEAIYHQKLKEWYEPSSPATFRWGWWRMFEGYGRAARSYAFAASSGRRQASQLDAAYLAKCRQQVILCADDQLSRSDDNAYGTSFPAESKHVLNAGWYFSTERAFDLAVGYQLDPKPAYLQAFVANMNYEMGGNPVNVTYVTGLGWKRQREIVHQYAQNDRAALPPSGIPLGNIQSAFAYQELYKGELHNMCFPDNSATTSRYPLYDRWTDIHNVTTEFVIMDQARSLAGLAFFSTLTPAKTTPWKPVAGQITLQPQEGSVGGAVKATLTTPGMDLNGARIVWEAKDNEPAYGTDYIFRPKQFGAQWVEAEAQWPDGRRIFAVAELYATNHLPIVNVTATTPVASEAGPVPGVFTFTRTGNTSSPMTVNYKFSGTATKWDDYKRPQGDIPEFIVIPAGASSATLTVVPVVDSIAPESNETIILTIQTNAAFNVGLSGKATVTISETATVKISRITRSVAGDVTVTWDSQAGKVYQVSYKNDLSEPTWQPLQSGITSAGSTTSWTDTSAKSAPGRFYRIVTSN